MHEKSDIRATVFKKLMKEKINLKNLQIADLYKMLHDGLYTRDEEVKNDCIKYL
jgi:hypothetical protein